jgi:hypothetical protein
MVETNEDGRLIMVRKGLSKFYDVKIEFINDQRYNNKLGGQFTEAERNMRDYTLGPLNQFMAGGLGSITILKTVKANGENVQISYVKDLECWSVSSKNVCLIARQPDEVDSLYTSDRFHFAKLMAHAWFDILSALPGKIQTSLKEKLSAKTLIGEYVGNQDYQHLVKYQKLSILFYALVDNSSDEICLPQSFTMTFLTQHCLDKVLLTNEGTFTDYDSLCDKLGLLYK